MYAETVDECGSLMNHNAIYMYFVVTIMYKIED